MVSYKPNLWEEPQALDVFTLYNKISVFHPKDHIISRSLILAIFYEETFCSNIRQNTGKGPAVGFGQTQIYDKEKIPFFKTLGFNSDRDDQSSSLPLITPEIILKDHDLSVKITCKLFQWLCARKEEGGRGKGIDGALEAQAGGPNKDLIPLWKASERELKTALFGSDRAKIAGALNLAKRPLKGAPFKDYTEYWNFTIPQSGLLWGIRE
jgi:hypothetical protein